MTQPYDPERLRLRNLCRQVIAEQLKVHGSMPEFFRTLKSQAQPLRIIEKDFYKVRSDSEMLSYRKLTRLAQLFEEAGLLPDAPAQKSEMLAAIDNLSRIAPPPEQFLRGLPRRMLCFRRSYLSENAINVSFVEITRDDQVIHYNETRVGTLADRLQNSEVRGTLVHRNGKVYVLGLNEFRTQAGIDRTEEAHSDILVLSILDPVPDSIWVFSGLHLGVTPADSVSHPLVPYASVVFMIETALSRDAAKAHSLVRNYAQAAASALDEALACDREVQSRFRRHEVAKAVSGRVDDAYGLLLAPAIAGATAPSDRRTQPNTRRKAGS
ncbi:MAG: hypothetical protein WDZ63_00850 [Burkholderiales bacterium]